MLRAIFVFGILAVGLVWGLRSRFAALQLYLWFAFFRPQEWMWWDVSGLRLSTVVGGVLLFPCLLSGVFPNVTHVLSIGTICFLLTAILGQISAFDSATGLNWLDFQFRLSLVCLLAVTLINSRRRFVITVTVVAASFGYHAARAGLSSILKGGVRFAEGFHGAFADNNGYALGMAMIAPLLVIAAQNMPRRYLQTGFFVAAGLCALGVVSTYSRGGLLALLAGTITLALFQPHRFRWLALCAVLSIPVWVFMTHQEGYLDRIQTISTYEGEKEESSLSRLHFWRVAVVMAETHPLGIGLFNYQSAYDSFDFLNGYHGRSRAVHSSHFQVLAETGFPGAFVWVSQFVFAFLVARRIRQRGSNAALAVEDRRLYTSGAGGLVASMAAFLVGGSFIALALNDLTWLTFALLAALDRISAAAVEAAQKQQVQPTGADLVSYHPQQPLPVGAAV